MPERANARRPSSQRGRLVVGVGDSGAGDPAGADARFDLDFSECIALSWPANTGLEQMLLAADLCGSQVPATAARMDSANEGGPNAATGEGGPETAEDGGTETAEAATEESGPETAEAAAEESGTKAAAEASSGPETAEAAAPVRDDGPQNGLEAAPAAASRNVPFSDLAGRVVEDMLPGPGLAGWLSRAEAGCLGEFELAGVAAACRRLASWATAAELTAVAEMTTRAAARDSSVPVETDGRPASVSPEAAAEVGLALTMSQFGAALWADLALNLRWRLPGSLAALSEGRIDLSRARLIAELTSVLSDDDARTVEERVLERAGQQTPGQLRAALRRAVITVDPAAAERRREEAERRARVGLYADQEGTATISGHNLPGVQACAAMARITALAQAMKAAGADGGIDMLRAQVLIGLLLNTLPGIPAPLEDPAAPGPVDPGQGRPHNNGAGDPPDHDPGDPQDQDPDNPPNNDPDCPSDNDPDDPPDQNPDDPPGHGPGNPPDHGPGNPPDHGPGNPPDNDSDDPPDNDPGDPSDRGPDNLSNDDPDGPPDQGPGDPPNRGRDDPPDRGPDNPRGDANDRSPPDTDGESQPEAGCKSPQSGGNPYDFDRESPQDGGRPQDNRTGPIDPETSRRGRFDPPDGWKHSPGDAGGVRAQPTADQDGEMTRPARGSGNQDACFGDRDPPDGVDDDVGGETGDEDPRRDDKWLRLPIGPVPAWPPLPAPSDAEIPVSGRPAGRAGRVVMEVPWRTLAGISAEPGSISWLGPITPNAARELAAMAAADPRTEWRVIVTDRAGWTILTTRVPKRGHQGRRLDQPSGGSGLVSRITLTLPLDLAVGLAEPAAGAAVAPGGSDFLRKVLAAALAAADKAVARAARVPGASFLAGTPGGTPAGKGVGGCDHTGAEAHYRPSDRLRELIVARDQTCRLPICRQQAWQSDLDHTVPFDDGGPTCRCNVGPVCRTHHQVKQRPGWQLRQRQPGIFEWSTPAGRRYLVAPDPHPI